MRTSQILNKEVKCLLGVSNTHGIGVFAIRDIKEGEELFKYSELYLEVDTEKLEPSVRKIVLDRNVFYNKIKNVIKHPNAEVDYVVFMNHSDNPNSDGVFALRDILSGEEIMETYRHEQMSDISRKHYNFIK